MVEGAATLAWLRTTFPIQLAIGCGGSLCPGSAEDIGSMASVAKAIGFQLENAEFKGLEAGGGGCGGRGAATMAAMACSPLRQAVPNTLSALLFYEVP